MPIYEYRCTACSRKFEQIVLRGRALEEACCPGCGSADVERLLSSFSMSGVSRKSEESFDDDFDAPDDDLAGGLGEESLEGEDDLGLGGAEGEEEDEDAIEKDDLDGGLGDELEDEDEL